MRVTFVVLLPLVLSAQSLEETVRAKIAAFDGTVSLYAKNLDTGAAIGVRENDPVRTASTIKLPILAAVFDAVERGKAKWTDKLTLTAGEKVSGSGVIGSEFSDGVELPLADVANLMIVLSDNTATNMLIERFGADAVNSYLESIGMKVTRSLRKIRGDGSVLKKPSGWSKAGRLPENEKYGIGVSTPFEMVSLLSRLESGSIVSPAASKQMIAILKRCQDSTGIRRKLSMYPIANKTGSLDALRADVAIVYAKRGRIALAITVDDLKTTGDYTPDNAGSLLIAELAKMIVDRL